MGNLRLSKDAAGDVSATGRGGPSDRLQHPGHALNDGGTAAHAA